MRNAGGKEAGEGKGRQTRPDLDKTFNPGRRGRGGGGGKRALKGKSRAIALGLG
jgi:hypothetical protein